MTDLELLGDIESLSEPVERALRRLAARLYGRIGRAGYEALALAVVDLPYGAVRRHLGRGATLPEPLPAQLEAAVRSALAAGPKRRPRPRAKS